MSSKCKHKRGHLSGLETNRDQTKIREQTNNLRPDHVLVLTHRSIPIMFPTCRFIAEKRHRNLYHDNPVMYVPRDNLGAVLSLWS